MDDDCSYEGDSILAPLMAAFNVFGTASFAIAILTGNSPQQKQSSGKA
jgi:hypothetical protein